MTVPVIAPEELKKADSFIPLKFTNVHTHMAIQITATVYNLLLAISGLNINAILDATKASIAGNQGRFSTHCMNMATKPQSGPIP